MKNPVQVIEALKTVVQIAIAWVTLMGFWTMTPAQEALTITFGITLVNFVGIFWEISQTTPLADPQAADGETLVRSSGSTRSASMK